MNYGESEAIAVIEVRAVKNGFVITGFQNCYQRESGWSARGYVTRVVEHVGDEPFANGCRRVGDVISELLRDHPITTDTIIPPARALP
jgi:hypothetical protein